MDAFLLVGAVAEEAQENTLLTRCAASYAATFFAGTQ